MALFRSETSLIKQCASKADWPTFLFNKDAGLCIREAYMWLDDHHVLNRVKSKDGAGIPSNIPKSKLTPVVLRLLRKIRDNHDTTTALPGLLLLESGWEEAGPRHRAMILVHEITHYLHRKHDRRWWPKYLNPFAPWNLVVAECRGYFASYHQRALSCGITDSYAYNKERIDALPKLLKKLYISPRFIRMAKLKRVVHAAAKKALQ